VFLELSGLAEDNRWMHGSCDKSEPKKESADDLAKASARGGWQAIRSIS